jgi:hypothetical protein
VRARNGRYGIFRRRADRSYSALMPAASITFPHFWVSSAMSLPKSAGGQAESLGGVASGLRRDLHETDCLCRRHDALIEFALGAGDRINDAAGESGTDWAARRHTDVGKRVDVQRKSASERSLADIRFSSDWPRSGGAFSLRQSRPPPKWGICFWLCGEISTFGGVTFRAEFS